MARQDYERAAVGMARRYGVDPELFGRLIQQESAWNPGAVSPAGAFGLTQAMPDTASQPGFGVAPLASKDDPNEQLRFGAEYFGKMVDRYGGDQKRALVAYNWGPGNADKWDGSLESLPAETRDYVTKISGERVAQADTGTATDAWQEVTDPEILKMLGGADEQSAGWEEVTDPDLLRELGGGQDENTPESPTNAEADRLGLSEDARKTEGEARSQPPTFWGGVLDSVMNGITFGYGDEVRALDAAIMGETPEGEYLDYSRPFWDRYDVAKAAEKTQREGFREERPGVAIPAEIGGSLLTGGGLARQGVTLAGRGATTAQRVGLGAAEGAGYGALYGSGEADNDRVGGALRGGAAGAALGGTITYGGQKFLDALARRGVIKSAPSGEALKAGASKAADVARKQGVVYDPRAYSNLVNTLERNLSDLGLDETLTPKVYGALRRFTELRGSQMPFDEMEKLRRIASLSAGSKEPQERMMGTMMVDAIDDFLATPGNVASATGDAALANASMAEMRMLWGRMRRAEMLDNMLEKQARQTSASGSGGNIDNKIRQGVAAVLNDPKKRRGFSPAEIQALDGVVNGTPTRNALRVLGKIAPGGNGLSLFLNLGGIYMEPSFIVASLAGTGAKFLSDRATAQALKTAQAMIRSGKTLPHRRAFAARGATARNVASATAGGEVSQP